MNVAPAVVGKLNRELPFRMNVPLFTRLTAAPYCKIPFELIIARPFIVSGQLNVVVL